MLLLNDQCPLDFDSDEPWYDGKSLKQWWGEFLDKKYFPRKEIFSRKSDVPLYLGHGAALLEGYGVGAQTFLIPTPDAEKKLDADAIEITGWVPGTDYVFGNDALTGSTTVKNPGYIQNLTTANVEGPPTFLLPNVTKSIPFFQNPDLKITSLLRDYDPCDDSKYLGFAPECFSYHPAGFHTGSGEMIMYHSPLRNGGIDLQGVCNLAETIPPVTLPALYSNIGNLAEVIEKAGGFTGLHPAVWTMHLCIDDDIYHPYLCSEHPNLPVMDNGEYVSLDPATFYPVPTAQRQKLCAARTADPDLCSPTTNTSYPYPWTQISPQEMGCKLPKLTSKMAGEPYYIQAGQVMTFWDSSSPATARKTYTDERPVIPENDQYVIKCKKRGYVVDQMCFYTCKDGALDTTTYCDAKPEDICVPVRERTINKQVRWFRRVVASLF